MADAKPNWILNSQIQVASAIERLVKNVRHGASVDWASRKGVWAKLRAKVKRILRKRGYSPDKQKAATERILAQAELCGGVGGESAGEVFDGEGEMGVLH